MSGSRWAVLGIQGDSAVVALRLLCRGDAVACERPRINPASLAHFVLFGACGIAPRLKLCPDANYPQHKLRNLFCRRKVGMLEHLSYTVSYVSALGAPTHLGCTHSRATLIFD
ncbi:hypothetical protein IG631_10175 [Alternaria alternata]|nr:hypothetical protein IG631_10175 [Alternaria alternata]